ncbi:hypothetical protein FGO68_gene13210 [Halteria grandinella]|uniref:Uncharacterized protein n=1 Tax=Halteria grandinella TaxID=5974 RepID=A0A8J8NKS4_HALGN|nr:hypothetical protein FGO68_gene13210 [Halteria grandinella]
MFCCDPSTLGYLEKKRACNFSTGRTIIGFIALLTGLQLWSYGQDTLEPHLHTLRLNYLPQSKPSDAVCSGTKITWSEFNLYTIQAEAVTFILAGVLLLVKARCLGSTLLLLSSLAHLTLRDGLWLLKSASRSPIKERNERIADIAQSLILIGAALYLMLDRGTQPCCQKKAVEVKAAGGQQKKQQIDGGASAKGNNSNSGKQQSGGKKKAKK